MKEKSLVIIALLLGTLIPGTLTPRINAQSENLVISNGDISYSYNSGVLNLTRKGTEKMIKFTGLGNPVETTQENKLVLGYGFMSLELYPVPSGLEFMAVFPDRPSNPRVSIPVDSPGLSWYYQVPFTELYTGPGYEGWTVNETHAFNDLGKLVYQRDFNVSGSYAVYDDSPGHVGTGKFTHVYRPYVYDSVGAGYYDEIVYEPGINGEGVLYIDLDSTWLRDKDRVYPIYVDPTFGYTNIGASTNSYAQDIIRGSNGTTTSSGYLYNLSIYASISTGSATLYGGVYDEDSGPDNLVEGETTGTSIGSTWNWYNVSFPSFSAINNNQNYWAMGWIDADGVNDVSYKADYQGASNKNSYQKASAWTGSWGDPFTGGGYNGYTYSLYVTYSSGPEPTAYTRSLTLSLSGVFSASRQYQGSRGETVNLGINPATGRFYEGLRSPSQGIGIVFLVSTAGITHYFRSLTLGLGFIFDGTTDVITVLLSIINKFGNGLLSDFILFDPDGSIHTSGNTDSLGFFNLGVLDPGNYTLQATREGYQTGFRVYSVTEAFTMTLTLQSLSDGVLIQPEAILQIFSILVWIIYMYSWIVNTWDGWGRVILGSVSTVLWMVSAMVIDVVDSDMGFIYAYLFYGFSLVTVVLVVSDTLTVYRQKMDWW